MGKKIIFDVTTAVENERTGQTFFVKVGIASTFTTQAGKNGININLDALPVNGKLTLWEQGDKNERPRGGAQRKEDDDLDDEVPFDQGTRRL